MSKSRPPFPVGVKIGDNCRRIPPNEIAAFDAALGLDLEPPTGMLTLRQVAQRYSVSMPTVHRWIAEGRRRRAEGS